MEVVLTANRSQRGRNPNTAMVDVSFLVASGVCVDPASGPNYALGCSKDADCPNADMSCNVDTTVRVTPSQLKFTSDDWNVPQKVMIAAFGDDVSEPDFSVQIFASAISTDVNYDGTNAVFRFGGKTSPDNAIVAQIKDRNVPGYSISPEKVYLQEGSSEGGVFSINLETKPWTSVEVWIDEISTSAGVKTLTVEPSMLIFTPQNWDIPVRVVATAADDSIDTGDADYKKSLVLRGKSKDGSYNQLEENFDIMVIEDDRSRVVIIGHHHLNVTEDGDTAAFEVVLKARPTYPVKVGFRTWTGVCANRLEEGDSAGTAVTIDSPFDVALSSKVLRRLPESRCNHDKDCPDGSVCKTRTLAKILPEVATFNSRNWASPQVFTITAYDDTQVEGTHRTFFSRIVESKDSRYRQHRSCVQYDEREWRLSKVLVRGVDRDHRGY